MQKHCEICGAAFEPYRCFQKKCPACKGTTVRSCIRCGARIVVNGHNYTAHCSECIQAVAGLHKESNINAKIWVLRDPSGNIHNFKNLAKFIADNPEHFPNPDSARRMITMMVDALYDSTKKAPKSCCGGWTVEQPPVVPEDAQAYIDHARSRREARRKLRIVKEYKGPGRARRSRLLAPDGYELATDFARRHKKSPIPLYQNYIPMGRVDGAIRIEGYWYIPKGAPWPRAYGPEPPDGYITVADYADRHKRTISAATKHVRDGRLPAIYKGRYCYIPIDAPWPLREKRVPKIEDAGEPPTPSGYIKAAEYAERSGKSIKAVRNHVWRGRLEYVKINGRVFIPEDAPWPEDQRRNKKGE